MKTFEIKTTEGRHVRHCVESAEEAISMDRGSTLVGEVIGDDLVDPYGVGSTRDISVLLDAHRDEVFSWILEQGFELTKRAPGEKDEHN